MEVLLESRMSNGKVFQRISEHQSWSWTLLLHGVLGQMIVGMGWHIRVQHVVEISCGLTASVILKEGRWNDTNVCRRYEQHAPVCLVPVAVDPVTFQKHHAATSCNSRISNVQCWLQPCWLCCGWANDECDKKEPRYGYYISIFRMKLKIYINFS